MKSVQIAKDLLFHSKSNFLSNAGVLSYEAHILSLMERIVSTYVDAIYLYKFPCLHDVSFSYTVWFSIFMGYRKILFTDTKWLYCH